MMRFIILLVITAHSPILLANEDDTEALLEELRRIDGSVSGVFVESSWVIPRESSGTFPVAYSGEYTQQGLRCALQLEFKNLIIDSGGGRNKGQFNRFPSVPALVFQESHIYASDFSGFRKVQSKEPRKTLEDLASNVPVRGKNTAVLQYVYNPEATDVAHRIFISKWVLGRGFSEHLTGLTSRSSLEDGTIEVIGPGFITSAKTGIWTLRLDPKLSLLAREATFTADGRSRADFRVETTGVLASVGDKPSAAAFAGEGTYVRLAGREAVFEVKNERIVRQFSDALFSKVYDRFGENLPIGSLVVDKRGAEDSYFTATPPVKLAISQPLVKGPNELWRLLLINVGVLGILLLILYVRFRRTIGIEKIHPNQPNSR
ncbi:MAG: hypothetical protein NT138_08560 [Planctomycetales bacterium]|nr:hypothetical protein [Planctomycetales bacterium]